MGFLDKAKQLAEQAKVAATDAGLLGGQPSTGGGDPGASGGGWGGEPRSAEDEDRTPSARLGRTGLPDPATLLLPDDLRDLALAAVSPTCVQTEVGLGLRWAIPGRAVEVLHLVDENLEPEDAMPTGDVVAGYLDGIGGTPVTGVGDEAFTTIAYGHPQVFVRKGKVGVVVGVEGLDPGWALALARTVAGRLPEGPPRLTDPLAVLAHLGLPDPRTLLGPDQLVAALGSVPGPPQLRTDDGVGALWQAGPAMVGVGWLVDLEAFAEGDDPKPAAARFEEGRRFLPTETAIPGLGDAAYGISSLVVVRDGDRVLSALGGLGEDRPMDQATVVALARAALAASRP